VLGRALQVRLVGVQPREPFALVGSCQLRGRRLRDRQEMRAVRGRHRGLTAGVGQLLGGELADGLQQPVPQRRPGRLGRHQALVHQRTEQAGHVEQLDVPEPAHRFGGVQIEALGEYRQAAQQLLLGCVQQGIRPLDGRP